MDLPNGVADPSLLVHEPLRSHITMYEASTESRSQSKVVVSSFVKAMRENDQAALASKTWAYWVFEGKAPPGGSTFEVTDEGERLFKAFFEYQVRLFGALQQNEFKTVEEYQNHVVRNGINAIKFKYHTQCSPQEGEEVGGKSEGDQPSPSLQRALGSNQAEIGDHCRHEENAAMGPISLPWSSSMSGNPATQLGAVPGTGAGLSASKATKSNKRSTSKGKKRKPSSQSPPVITPSDASEDEEKQPETCEIIATSSLSHRLKRMAPNSSRTSPMPPVAEGQTAERTAPYKRKMTPGTFRPLATSRSSDLVSRLKKGRHSVGSPLGRRGRNKDVFKRISKYRKLQGIKSTRDPLTRPSKRLRFSSMPALGDERGEASEFTHKPRARSHDEPLVQKLFVTEPLSIRKSRDVRANARKKRTRPEFETSFHDSAPANFCEFLGPDTRPLRPIPRKVHNKRVVLAADEGTSTRRIPCGVPSLEHADQLLRDVASNALAVLEDSTGLDIPDWTQDKDQDAEYDDLDDDEMDDAQIATTSAPSMVTPKPRVPAHPRIWAQSRQEVCESFEHFRSYHSGVYSKDDIVKGYLLGAYAASRDIFHHDGKLIISHGGGKSESILDTRRGPKRHQMDQDQEASDKSVRALLKTCKDRRPLVLLADDKYALFPYDLTSEAYTYVVLGLYWISHAWAECQPTRDGSGRIVRWKFAFQWCEGQGNPWWTPQQDMGDVAPKPSALISDPGHGPSHVNAGESSVIRCKSCQEQSPFVYKQGWMCLNPRCDVFWTIDDREPKELDYREEFLNLLPQKFETLPNIIPARVLETPGGVTTTLAFSKGWHCVQCGRLSCRYKWEHWECSNCGSKHEVKGRVRSPKEFWHQRPPKEFLHSQVGKESGILACRLEPINLGPSKGFTSRLTFILPHDRGKIHLILGTPFSNGDADYIFQLYQQQASIGELRLRRYPLRNHRARGLLLTNYFSQNSGEPYQYVGGTGNTVPFDEAPDCVRQALAVIKERSRLALHADIPFNEILSAAYMERQKMSFHSDSEKGLGPVVASLSLGSAALMHFRPHVNVGDPKGKSSYALTLVLRHGDVLVMEGDGVQKYYEHTVIPMNFRIAATARCIGST